MAKVATTLGAAPMLLAWDENDLPEPKEAIRAEVLAAHGVWMVSKSDLVSTAELDRMTALERSLIDSEPAGRARVFVGLTRSTFSNLVAFQAATGSTHYIYNAPCPGLVRRWDRGTCPDARSAGNPLLALEPLLPLDETGGLKLTVVVVGYGEVSNIDGLWAGMEGAAISGFALHRLNEASIPVEYRALTASGWSDRVGKGMAGTGGGDALLGFAVRGDGVSVVGLFEGGAVRAGNGEDCIGPGGLAALQVVIEQV